MLAWTRRARCLLLLLSALGCASAPAQPPRGAIYAAVPAAPRPDARYLIYLHGRIIEEKGPRPTDERFGVYEYQAILDTLAAAGIQVIAEQRPSGTEFRAFGAHAADQVRALRTAGVPAERIAIVGFSKGGAIAMIASALLQDPELTFVFLGACGDWVKGRLDVDVRGRILSIYEASDELGTSCASLFSQARVAGNARELRITTGARHGAFYRPRAEWLEPVVRFVARRPE